MRLWNLELPTKDKLHKRSQNTYKDATCTRCNKEKETNTHVFQCSKNPYTFKTKLSQIINEEVSGKVKNKIGNKLNREINEHIESWTNETTNIITRGAITTEISSIIKKFVTKEDTTQVIKKIIDRVYGMLEEGWKTRNQEFQEWEREKQITKKDKRKWKTNIKSNKINPNIEHNVNSIMNITENNWVNWNTLYSYKFLFSWDR
jgi:hypothetical protein